MQRGEAHLWRAELSLGADDARASGVLSSDEWARAERFRFASDRRRFLAARLLLRQGLGRYLGVEPGSLVFAYGPHGKPSLAENCGLKFNLSHCEDAALLAVAADVEVGVDIERLRAFDDAERLAAQFFAEGERSAFLAAPPEKRDAGFLRIWTRKEAYVKALGEGLSLPLRDFDALNGAATHPGARLCDLPLGAAHVGAFAALADAGKARDVVKLGLYSALWLAPG